jgi:hypothetical protein
MMLNVEEVLAHVVKCQHPSEAVVVELCEKVSSIIIMLIELRRKKFSQGRATLFH